MFVELVRKVLALACASAELEDDSYGIAVAPFLMFVNSVSIWLC